MAELTKEQKQAWTLNYVHDQIRDQEGRLKEIETQLAEAEATVTNLKSQKCHRETILYMLRTIVSGLGDSTLPVSIKTPTEAQ